VRPAPAGPATRDLAGVDDVETVVRRFYQAVIPDPTLGPIFAAMVVDWGEHIPKLVDFWMLRLFDRPGYRGNAAGAHVPVLDRVGFGDEEMQRWLELWTETVDELFVGPVAELAKERALMAATAIGSLARRHAETSGAGVPTGIA